MTKGAQVLFQPSGASARVGALDGRLRRGASAGLAIALLVVSSFVLISINRLGHSTGAATRAARLTDLYQDARFFAAYADAAHQDVLRTKSPTARTTEAQAISSLESTLAELGRTRGAERRVITELQAEAADYARATAALRAVDSAGRPAPPTPRDVRVADRLPEQLVQQLSAVEESTHVSTEAHLVAASDASQFLARAAPPVVGGGILLGLVLTSVLRRYRQRVETLALTDPLTGLPNRLQLQRFTEHLLGRPASDEPSATTLLLLDLDGFKEVNDGLGHHYGDALLCAVAERLQAVVGADDLVVRLGGDEFAVVLRSGGRRAGQETALTVLQQLREPFLLDDLTVEVGVSIGIAVAFGDHLDLAGLLRRADVAMYQAKDSGGHAVLFTAEQDTAAHRRVHTISELRLAIDRDELVLHYQPKVALDDGHLVGVEALVRWQHPSRGLLLPGTFLPDVEDAQIMERLTAHVLGIALRQAASWQHEGHHIPVAVNVPTRSLTNPDFPALVEHLLEQVNIPGASLCLEITETSAMRHPARCIQSLARLRSQGVRISIDDYGTGYASMSYLRDLPVDELKIDRSFITNIATDPSSAILASAIIDLGHQLGLAVVAEGVENQIVAELLREGGCDVVQGYDYARPMAAELITQWRNPHQPAVALPVRGSLPG
ncbi:MAG: bifunctional diguanylate cyclase/phosphodiesterase [Frankiales bacterium]|nr:bifunctional diguanylate cyclase/phosphodiesterase [Frankiales bacterium]